jgi:NADH-quinone oxidoreductase subunit C
MKPTLERLTEQFTELIGPEAFAKAEAARTAMTASAAKPGPTATAIAAPVAGVADPGPDSASPATIKPAAPVAPAAPRPAPVAPPPLPPLPVQVVAHAAKGYHFDAIVAPPQVLMAASILAEHGFALDAITGVDWPAQNEMEVVYDYFHPTESLRIVVRTRVPRATPELPTISSLYPGANWHEREAHDFFGLIFAGHPNLKPFLLPEDADFHPLRKDYTP